MITDENLNEIERVALAAKDGEGGYGTLDLETAMGLAAKTSDSKVLWSAYVKDSEGDLVTAITGNGPTSEANAKLFSGARHVILGLVGEIRRMRAGAQTEQAKLMAYQNDITEVGQSWEPNKSA